jgi:hypothetical protein
MANARVRLTRSTKPDVCGCSPVANTCLIFNLSIASAVTLAVKAVPWSEMIRAGQLCVYTTLFVRNSTDFYAVVSGTAAISTYLDKASMATMMPHNIYI